MTLIVSIAIILAVFLLATGIVETARMPGDVVEERLGRIARQTPLERQLMDGIRMQERAALEEEQRAAVRRREFLPTFSRLLHTQFWFDRLEEDLKAARSPWKATEIIAASLLIYALLAMVIALSFDTPLGFLVALPAFGLPWLLVKRYSTRFLRRFEVQLADTLSTMANALRAGFSFMQAVELVAREALPPISEEFRMMMQEINVGISPDQALLNFSARVKSPDVELMVTAVIIQRRVGGALGEMLDTIAGVIRERVRLRGQVRTLTAQGRYTGTVLALLPIVIGGMVILVSMFTPGAGGEHYLMPLFDTRPYQQGGYGPYGIYLIVIAIILQIMGFLSIRKITTIEV